METLEIALILIFLLIATVALSYDVGIFYSTVSVTFSFVSSTLIIVAISVATNRRAFQWL